MMRPELSNTGRGVRFGGETLTIVPADAVMRPLRDQLIVEPLGTMHSRHILVVESNKPVRGIVKAAGPGHYPKQYDHPEKHRRTKMWEGKRFQPTQVKVGDVVELGGAEHGGYSFESFFWGDILHIHCREADVCGICVDITPEQAREDVRVRLANDSGV